MNKSLVTFMSLAAVAVIVFGLIGGIVYPTMVEKNELHQEVVEIDIDYQKGRSLLNTSLSTFMKIGLTSLAIGILLFGIAFNLLKGETQEHSNFIEEHIHEEYR